jgi:predicted nucleotidyltransferase
LEYAPGLTGVAFLSAGNIQGVDTLMRRANMIPIGHQHFIERAVNILRQDEQIAGVALGGSYITGNMDEFSDLNLVIAVNPEATAQVMRERINIAGKLGKLLSLLPVSMLANRVF